MKRTGLLLALLLVLLRSYADEGMWLPMLLGQQVYDNMVKKGLKLTREQLYSINKASLKDAIVLFGDGCTGEVVSGQGLIFTNHHCGYESVAALSTVEHNYLHDGFYAHNFQEELPAEGLSVQFLDSAADVTKLVDSLLQGLSGVDRVGKQRDVLSGIAARFTDPVTHREARVSPLFGGNQFVLFIMHRYTDIRLVGVPPESVGKFGGNTDNLEWPRYTGDFSVWRVYATHDGKARDYNPENIPLKPRYSLPISIKGVKEGDLALVYGYPGSTNRYEPSFGVKMRTDVIDPAIAHLFDVQLGLMKDRIKADPSVRLKLASNIAIAGNVWKMFDGERKALLKHDVYGQREITRNQFIAWASVKPEYKNVFLDYGKIYNTWTPYTKARLYLNSGILGSPLLAYCSTLSAVEIDLITPGKEGGLAKAIAAADQARKVFLKNEDIPSDMKIVAAMLQAYYTDIPKDQHPVGFFEGIKSRFGDPKEAATYQTYASSVFSNTFILNDAKWKAFMTNPDGNVLQEDPAYAAASAFLRNYNSRYASDHDQFINGLEAAGRNYMKGLLEEFPGKAAYPDANQTLRLTYGNVKSYSPSAGVNYDYACTMKGVLQKYVPGDDEFDLPAKFLELARNNDFGVYKDVTRNDLVVTFITTDDITGGNSGSPVLNNKGELIGLAFDGNYESLDGKYAYDPATNRAICVDIRYVLWCIDKLGGAANIIGELTINTGAPKARP